MANRAQQTDAETLAIYFLKSSDSGQYSCIVTASDAYDRKDFQLIVETRTTAGSGNSFPDLFESIVEESKKPLQLQTTIVTTIKSKIRELDSTLYSEYTNDYDFNNLFVDSEKSATLQTTKKNIIHNIDFQNAKYIVLKTKVQTAEIISLSWELPQELPPDRVENFFIQISKRTTNLNDYILDQVYQIDSESDSEWSLIVSSYPTNLRSISFAKTPNLFRAVARLKPIQIQIIPTSQSTDVLLSEQLAQVSTFIPFAIQTSENLQSTSTNIVIKESRTENVIPFFPHGESEKGKQDTRINEIPTTIPSLKTDRFTATNGNRNKSTNGKIIRKEIGPEINATGPKVGAVSTSQKSIAAATSTSSELGVYLLAGVCFVLILILISLVALICVLRTRPKVKRDGGFHISG